MSHVENARWRLTPMAYQQGYRLEREYVNNLGSRDWYGLGLGLFKTVEAAQTFIAGYNEWLGKSAVVLATSGEIIKEN